MIVVDTSGVLVLRDRAHRLHRAARSVVEEDQGPFLLSPFCLAEIDYLLREHVSREEQLSFLDDVASGAYRLVPIGAEEIGRAKALIEGYADLGLSLADASLVGIADAYDTDRVLTLDERDFRVLVRGDGRPFRLLPADA